jgi:myo-inositol-1(or 4)-monophosphatase
MVACLDLASGAGALIAARREKPRTVEFKGEIDLVTDADHASEAFLVAEVQRRFPDHSILVEESGAKTQVQAPAIWVMDPLDGTTNFAHGFPYYGVSVAVCEVPLGRAYAACVYDPTRSEAFVAGRGQGAWRIGPDGSRTRLRVSACQKVRSSLLATGFPYERNAHADNNHAEYEALNLACQGVRRPGAAALDLANVAAGTLDGFWEAHLKPWDLAAGALLIQEAGGVVTGYDGAAFDGTQLAVAAAGPGLHGMLLLALQKVRSERGFPPVPTW